MLKRKMLRDIKFNKSQFITIFLMVFLGMLIFSSISSHMDGMRIGVDRYYEDHNLPDIWVMSANFTEEELAQIKEINNIQDAERRLTTLGTIDEIENSTAQLNFIETNNISRFYVAEGIEFNPEVDAVWMDAYWSRNNELTVGDVLTINHAGQSFERPIMGLVFVPDRAYNPRSWEEIFPTFTDYGFIYLPAYGIPVFNYVLVDIYDTNYLDKTITQIEDILGTSALIIDRRNNSSVQVLNSEIEEGNAYVIVFSGIFLFVSILSVVTTMNRIVKKQRTEIGMLKALGFKDRKIMGLYISYAFWISLVAIVLAILIGPPTIGQSFLNMVLEHYALPEIRVTTTIWTYLAGISIILLVCFVTYLACKKVLKEKATELLLVGDIKSKRKNINLNKGLLKWTSFSTKWNIRDILRNKARTIMAIVGVAGCSALIICAFGLLNTLNDYIDWQFHEIFNFEYRITLSDDYTEEEFYNIVSLYGNNTSKTLHIRIQDRDETQINTATIDDSNGLLRFTNRRRDFIGLEDNGVYLTYKLADTLNLSIGDTLNWSVLFGEEEWHTSEIIGLTRNPRNQNISMSRGYLASRGITYIPDTVYTNYDLSGVNEIAGAAIIQDRDSLQQGMENMIDGVRSMLILLIGAAVILGVVIIYNLGVLSFTEKTYQFATLKVLGFRTKQIRGIFIKQSIWITFVSAIIGAPLGYYMTRFIYWMALAENYDMPVSIYSLSYIFGIAGTLLVSITVNYFLSKKVKTINMVESLKANG